MQFLFLLFIQVCCLVLLIPSDVYATNPVFPTESGDKASISKISQDYILNSCQIKVGKLALYLCRDKSYIFQGTSASDKYSEVVFRDSNVIIDGDIDDGSIILATKTKLFLFEKSSYQASELMKNKSPVLIRIKSKENHALIMMIYHQDIESEAYSSTFSEEEEEDPERILKDSNDTDLVFIIQSKIMGKAPHDYLLRFPSEDLDFKLRNESFIEAAIVTDPILGRDYFFVTLERGWLFVFQTIFENPEIHLIQKSKLNQEGEIKAMVTEGDFLFFIFENAKNKRLLLEIHRMNFVPSFSLRKECQIDLTLASNVTNITSPPQLRVKSIENTFIVAVNYPGDRILVYTFQRPQEGIFPLSCPTIADSLLYGKAYYTMKLGYSFDYVILQYEKGTTEHGFLLSPLTENLEASYFIPYCMPNYFLTKSGTCIKCWDSFSRGGLAKSCQSCNKTDVFHTLALEKDPMKETCPQVCTAKARFGPDCTVCQNYLQSSGAILPTNALGVLESNDSCSFSCPAGYVADRYYGQCLQELDLEIQKDQCLQITDCLNCSLSQSCSWCSGTCKSRNNCNDGSHPFGDILQDYFLPAMQCEMEKSCGPRAYHTTTGNFTFGLDSVKKNQLCLWYPEPQYGDTNEISLTLHLEETFPNPWDNPPALFVKSCSDPTFEEKCLTRRLPKEANKTITFRASNIVFFVWVEESIPENARNFRIEYVMTPAPSLAENLFSFLRLCSQAVFTLILFSCMISTCRNIYSISRRGRLLRQLQALEIIRLVQNGETEHNVINVEEIMENQRIVHKVVYDKQNNDYEQTECPICLETFNSEENLAKLDCKHMFHIQCFGDWVKAVTENQHIKCPVCNRVFA